MYDGSADACTTASPSISSPVSFAVPSVCHDCSVRQDSVCGSLDDGDLRALHRHGRRQQVMRGDTIFWAGEESRSCANVLAGVFKLSALTQDGREQIVGLLHPSDFVGHPYATDAEFTVTALSDGEICLFPMLQFEEVLEAHSGLGRAFLKRTLKTLDDTRRRMLLLGRQSAEERVAGFLLDIADRPGGCSAGAGRPLTFDLPLSRGAMADLLGLTIETVSRHMTRLKSRSIIALPGGRGVTILDRSALEHLHGNA